MLYFALEYSTFLKRFLKDMSREHASSHRLILLLILLFYFILLHSDPVLCILLRGAIFFVYLIARKWHTFTTSTGCVYYSLLRLFNSNPILLYSCTKRFLLTIFQQRSVSTDPILPPAAVVSRIFVVSR